MGRNINDVLREERAKKVSQANIDKALGIEGDKKDKTLFNASFTYFNNNKYSSTSPYSSFNDGKYLKFKNTMPKHNIKDKNQTDEELSGIPVGASDSYGMKGVDALKTMFLGSDDDREAGKDEEFQELANSQAAASMNSSYTNDNAATTPETESGLTGNDKKLAEITAAQEAAIEQSIAPSVEDEAGVYALSNIYV